MKYVYEGPGPHIDAELGLVHPGDVRVFDEEPSWGPWRLLDEPQEPAEPPVTPPAAPAPASPPAASTTALVKGI